MSHAKTISKLILCTSLILSSSFSLAGSGGEEEPKRKGRGLLKQLDLSSEQKDKLKELRKAFKEQNPKTWKQGDGKALKEKMKNSYISGSDSELQSIHSQIKDLRFKKMDRRFKRMIMIRSVLTPEQRAKFKELKDNLRSERRNRRSE